MDKVSNNLLGIFWKLVSCGAFAVINTIVRFLVKGSFASKGLSVDQITFYQNVVSFIVMIPFFRFQKDTLSLRTKRPILHLIRVVAAVSGTLFLYEAFAHLPMAQAVALQFVGPVFTVLGARFYLKESLGVYKVAGIILGLMGAGLISRPDRIFFESDLSVSLYTLYPLLSAFCYAVVRVIERKLGREGENATVLAFFLVFFMMPVSAVPVFGHWTLPSMVEIFFLVLLGIFGYVAHFAGAKAFCFSEVVFLTPFGFARIFFTALFGYLFFQEIPQGENTWIGFLLVTVSTVLIVVGEEEGKKKVGL